MPSLPRFPASARIGTGLRALACAGVLAWTAGVWLGDDWWLLQPVIFGPRWPALALLGVWLLAGGVRTGRRVLATAALAVLLGYGVLGVRVGPGRLRGAAASDVVVVTFNAAGARGTTLQRLAEWQRARAADAVLLTECPEKLAASLSERWGGTMRTHMDLCLWSRHPISQWAGRPPQDIWQIGGAGAVASGIVATPTGPIAIGGVHLETPREGLEEFKDFFPLGRPREAVVRTMRLRDVESRLISTWLAGRIRRDEAIIAGDFNTPVESSIYRAHWGRWSNAWSEGGLGAGATKFTRWFSIRIDHIVHGAAWRTIRTEVGPDLGSDHRPLIARLRRVSAPP